MQYLLVSKAAGRRRLFLLVAIGITLTSGPAGACTTCNQPLQAALFTAGFPVLLLKMLLPLPLLGLLVRRLYRLR